MSAERHTARLVLKGHIIDSMMLPQIMDLVMDIGGNFTIEELRVGQHKTDTSLCRMEVVATTPEQLDRIVRQARALGATVESEQPARLEKVAKEGVFPEGFYSTSNLPTEVLLDGRWVVVDDIEMDHVERGRRSRGNGDFRICAAMRAGRSGNGRWRERSFREGQKHRFDRSQRHGHVVGAPNEPPFPQIVDKKWARQCEHDFFVAIRDRAGTRFRGSRKIALERDDRNRAVVEDVGFYVVRDGAVGAEQRVARPYAGGVEDLRGWLLPLPGRMIGGG